MTEIIKVQDSRRVFIDTLIELREKDDRVILIVPDVGFNYCEEFSRRFPSSFKSFGVTEQSTTMIAVGLALSGFKPYVYSMINFVAFRPFEMVRNGIAMHKAPVVLLGVKGSSSYKFLGFSHNLIFENEDLYHLSPYLNCYVPETNEGVKECIKEVYNSNKAAYIRL